MYFEGTDQADNAIGTAAGDYMHGKGGNDTLDGSAGDDYLFGEAGADVLIGGTGTDTAGYDESPSGVTVALFQPGLNKGEAAGDTYQSIENVWLSNWSDVGYGDAGANWFEGFVGNDSIHGQGGNDTLLGGPGND